MIRYLVMDVDGTLTDGKIYMGPDGELTKCFDVKDGAGISMILPQLSITPVIITSRESRILENRCKELNITHLYQGASDKLETMKKEFFKGSCDFSSVAYVGDDLPDISCMEEIKKAGGVVLCPADATLEVKRLADYISGYKAGYGAIRDCIHYLALLLNNSNVNTKIDHIVKLILSQNRFDMENGILSDGTPYKIQEYVSREEKYCDIESHRYHVDIHYMISGRERFSLYSERCLTSKGIYNEKDDVDLWNDGLVSTHSILVPGSIVVVMNNQPYKCSIAYEQQEHNKKLICRVRI